MDGDINTEPFPAPFKRVTGIVNGLPTEVELMSFADKIMITVSQGGRLAQWIQVSLANPSPATVDMPLPSAGLTGLPPSHLTPKTLLGGGGEKRETIGHLYATQIANHLLLRDPTEKRSLLLGLGLEKTEGSQEAYFDLLELVMQIV